MAAASVASHDTLQALDRSEVPVSLSTSPAARRRSGRRARRRAGPRPTPGRRAGARARRRAPARGPTPSLPLRAGRRRRARTGRRSRSRSSAGTPGPRSSTAMLDAVVAPSHRARRVAPPPYFAALSSRLAITRTRRRLSARIDDAGQLGCRARRARSGAADHDTAWMTSSPQADLLELEAPAPASKREISSRSSTSCWKRSTSADHQVERGLGRASGISSRRDASTSIEAARVMSGERSSWLTSDGEAARRGRCGPRGPGPCG